MSSLADLESGGAARALFGDPSGFPRELAARLGEHDLGEAALSLAWELSGCATGLAAPERRALVLLLAAQLVCARQGSTRLPVAGPERTRTLDPIFHALGSDQSELERALALLADPRLAPLVGVPGDYRPLVVDGDWLYSQRMRAYEDRLVTALSARFARRPLAAIDRAARAALDDLLARPTFAGDRPVELSSEQRRAIETALTAPLTVISGEPGTGKTSVVASLLRLCARLGISSSEIALAAPTGKAAWRLRESIERSLSQVRDPAPADRALLCPEARTLHRLLGYSPESGRFRRHENDRLAERVVIVDEGSMIDLYLMDRLVRAVRDDARLIILGDADQLPSVEAGAVFRDLLPCVKSATVLTRSYRMDPADPAGRNILSVARRMNRGQAPDFAGDGDEAVSVRASARDLAFERVELLEPDGAAELEAFLDRWWSERISDGDELDALARRVYHPTATGFDEHDRRDLGRLFDHHQRSRLLCVTRGEQPAGAARLNALIHRRVVEAARARGEELAPGALYPGEPVLVVRNDYDRALWNGDQGLVLRVAEGRRPPEAMALFPRASGDFAFFHLDSLRPLLERGYATTVHKSQGSEHDCVALLLPDEDLPLLTRELLYTAITRARRSVLLVGSRALLATGAARTIRRHSGLTERLSPTPPRQLALF